MVAVAVAFGLALAAAACGGERHPGTVTERDSDGVRIVATPRSLIERPSGWQVSAQPNLVIGAAQGDSADLLFAVTGVAQLDDGRILVVNGGTHELRFYDGTGRLVRSVGGEGDGPGEFRFPALLAVTSADTIVVFDPEARRFSVLNGQGRFVRTIPLTAFIGSPVGRVSGGRIITESSTASAGPDSQEGEIANSVVFATADPRAGILDTVAVAPGASLYLWKEGRRFGFTPVPFTAQPAAVVAGDLVYVVLTHVPEIRTYRVDGRLLRIVRVLGGLPDLPRSAFTNAVRQLTDGDGDAREAARLRRVYAAMSRPRRQPLFDRVLVDRLGDVWARRLLPDTASGPRRWVVFEGGRPLGSIQTPAGLHVEEIGEAYLLGVARGRDGVERVERFRLER